MKLIPLRTFPKTEANPTETSTVEFIRQLMKNPPQPRPGERGGFTPDEVMQGAIVLKALRALPPDATELLLESADHKFIVDVMNRNGFIGGEETAQMIDDLRSAKEPPPKE